jgi:hypothetical protein
MAAFMASLTLAALAGLAGIALALCPCAAVVGSRPVCASAAALLNVSQGLVASHWAPSWATR